MRPHEALHRPDIKDVGPVIPEDSSLEFDPRREITEIDWRKMDECFEQVRTDTRVGSGIRNACFVAADMAAIDFDRTAKHLTPEIKEAIITSAQEDRDDAARRGWLTASGAAACLSFMAIFEPEKVRAMVHDEDWEIIARGLLDLPSDRFQRITCAIATIDAERSRPLFTEEVWQRIEDQIVGTRPSVAHFSVHDTCAFAHDISVMAAFDPKRVRPFITPADWSRWKEILETSRENNISTFMDLASSLTRLSRALHPATVVKDQPPASTPMPPVRKF